MGVGRQGARTVPHRSGILTARDARQHGAEEGHVVDVNGGRSDVVADLVHPGVMTRANRLVEVGAVGRLRERGVEAEFVERSGDDLVEILDALVVDAGTHRGVQRREYLVALLGGCSGDDADGAPRVLESLAVLIGNVLALVEDGETHDVEVDVDRPDLLGLQDPARGDPAPRAERVEPEIDAVGGLCLH
ncbi:Uncharacterised protein [Clostridioides difficile]|nr:Uncharacterised protein [Clostridioides difficile]